MSRNRGARPGLWTADHALALGGFALVALGATSVPLALPLGWAALSILLFARLAESQGIAVPRPGRVPIRSLGAWKVPLAFTVRHRRRLLLFTREESVEDGSWSDTYTVLEQEKGAIVAPCWELPLARSSEWSPRGRAPVRALRFEHHERASYVERRSLERALAATRCATRDTGA